jgi:tripartite-type tricarboxylate transporter receptor subunit TctC
LHPEIRSRIENLGAIVMGNSPADFAIYLKRDFSRWDEVIKAAGVTAD